MRLIAVALTLLGFVDFAGAQGFSVGTARAERGRTATGFLEVPAGADAATSIPVVVVHGARPGPVLAIVSGAHGTEYASIVAVEKLIGLLDPGAVAGTVILVPLVNRASFDQKVVHVNPVDGKSMNRFYPGRLDGTQTERASYLITREIVDRCDHLIDLHGGDLDESLRPYSYWTKTGREDQDRISRGMVLAFGLERIIVSTDRPRDPAASRYLENTATTRGKPSLTAEAGHAGTVEPGDVEALVRGCLSVMRYLKMLPGAPEAVAKPVWITSVVTVTSDEAGLFYPLVARGAAVAKGASIGYVTDLFGKTTFEAKAPVAGEVLYICSVPSMLKGGTIANIGVPEHLGATARADDPRPPETRVAETVDTLHGASISDPYRWLEDQSATETRAWIAAQNAYTEAVIGPLPGRERIEKRLTELIKIDTVSVPFARAGRYFYTRRAADQEQAILYVKKGEGAREEVLVDPHGLSPEHSISASFQDVSLDGRLVAYLVREGGEDEVEVRFMDVDTRRGLEALPKARYSGISISADKAAVYYSRLTKEGPRVYRHRLGSAEADVELFGRDYGPEKIIGVDLSGDGRYLLVTVLHGSAARKTEVYVQDLGQGTPLRPIVNDLDAVFTGRIGGDTLFLRTNWNAPNYRVLAVDLRDPAREKWREVVPEGKSVISNANLAGGHVFVSRLEDVQLRIQAYTAQGKPVREVPLPGLGSTGGMAGEWDLDEAFFLYSSLAQPQTIYRHRVSSGQTDVWARLAVPVASDAVDVRQVFYTSKDGTRVPMFVAHRKGLVPDGKRPTLLTAYGGFNQAQLPSFSARAAFWIEQGGVYALANLRGGSEYGENWHRAGMLERKQNVFDDFIAAAEWLIANRYASPDTLAISGNSNGGLLVGAAMTQRPELFKAVVCGYPLLDMLRYHRFLVARYWVPEYGSAEDAVQFPVLRAYSPYHNVRRGVRYPAVLFITGDGDTRVAPLHARKMAALMQASAASAPDRPILLHYDTKAGHSGGLPASKQIEDLTQEMRFLFWQLGLDQLRVGSTVPRPSADWAKNAGQAARMRSTFSRAAASGGPPTATKTNASRKGAVQGIPAGLRSPSAATMSPMATSLRVPAKKTPVAGFWPGSVAVPEGLRTKKSGGTSPASRIPIRY